jgi:hypothetical protein
MTDILRTLFQTAVLPDGLELTIYKFELHILTIDTLGLVSSELTACWYETDAGQRVEFIGGGHATIEVADGKIKI